MTSLISGEVLIENLVLYPVSLFQTFFFVKERCDSFFIVLLKNFRGSTSSFCEKNMNYFSLKNIYSLMMKRAPMEVFASS